MPEELVAGVRRFNRTITAHVGALNDSYLGGGRPLGEARVLWEIGPEGCELRTLRERLGLDSGYASRLLRSLETEGLVTVEPGEQDRRGRTLRLTASGVEERERLDARSDDLARSLLEPLAGEQREQLASAMRTVERLLLAGSVRLETVDPAHPDAVRCVEAYFAELDRRAGTPPGAAEQASLAVEHDAVRPPRGEMLVAYLHGEPVGCGAVKHHGDEPSEIKRLWVGERVRGLGVGRRLLGELEARAAQHGASRVHLDTNRNLTEAIAMYRSSGYVDIPAFNDEPFAHHWFEKRL
jgi:DNA-binding MarR family transcriptional regulator/GNAT superfamily N-acetyltransferase